MSGDVVVPVTAATASAEVPMPTVWVKTGTIAAGAVASAPAPAVVVLGQSAVLVYATVAPHYHLAAHDHDPIALGSEVGLLLAVLFIGGRLVVCRLLRLPPSAS